MKTNLRSVSVAAVLVGALVVGGCGRDVRVNSDPGPGGPSAADSGKPVHGAAENSKGASSGAAAKDATTGTDSTGRPSDASGGTTGTDSASGTSATHSDQKRQSR